jgi:hypothetical protein
MIGASNDEKDFVEELIEYIKGYKKIEYVVKVA